MFCLGENKKKKNKKNFTFLISVIAIIVVISTAVLAVIYHFGGLKAVTNEIIAISEKHFLLGLMLFLMMQTLQIIISVIPGEPLEVMSGMLYGTLGGFFWCTVGIILGSALIFWAVRKYGIKLVERFVDTDELFNYDFMKHTTGVEAILFILFLIPGTPKDTLIYVAALSKIKLSTFLIITSFARIPSIITSTYAGSNLGQGNIGKTVGVFIVIALIGMIGIYLQPKIMKKLKEKRES